MDGNRLSWNGKRTIARRIVVSKTSVKWKTRRQQDESQFVKETSSSNHGVKSESLESESLLVVSELDSLRDELLPALVKLLAASVGGLSSGKERSY